MKLMKLTAAAVVGGLAANALLKGARARTDASPARSAGLNDGARATSRRWAASPSESPNEGERLMASRPDNALAGIGSEALDPLRSNSREGSTARSTGLSDFSRGA